MTDFTLYLMLMGMLSSGQGMPFWATANQYGLWGDCGPYAAATVIGAYSDFDESRTFQWRCGGSLAAVVQPSDGFDGGIPGKTGVRVIPDELYASGRWKALRLDIGMKHREREFLAGNGLLGSLSTSSGHMVESGNTRAMPGYEAVLEPLALPFTGGRLKIAGSYGDFRTLDDRYVKGALVHRMKAYIRYDFSPVFYAQIGLDHYALWGGWSPDHGQMPTGFGDYLRVITGRSASASGTASDQINVLGDQGGAEQFRFGWKTGRGTITLQYEKPYSDKSGMTFQNIPDGLYTLHFARKDRHAWISDVLLERMYTMYQSGTIHDRELDDEGRKIIWNRDSGLNFNGGDDYFVNFEYKSGWSYFGRSICTPLLTPDWRREQNTRAKAWHLALAGELFRVAPYKLMLTLSTNYGTYFKPFFPIPGTEYGSAWNTGWKWWQEDIYDKGLRQFSAAFTCCLPLSSGRGKASVDAVCGLYTDIGEYIRFRTGSPCVCAISFGIRIGL